MPRSKASDTPVFDPQAQNQGRIFCRLLVKLNAFARSCGAGMVVAELPVENMKTRPRYRSKRRRNDFLEHTAQNMLADVARVELVLETNPIATGVVRISVAPNRFSRSGGVALIDVHARTNAKL